MRLVFFVCILTLLSCSQKQDNNLNSDVDSTNETVNTDDIDSLSGDIIINKDTDSLLSPIDYQITAERIGDIYLGDSIHLLDTKFKNIQNQIISSEGIDWDAKLIDLGNNEYILAENTYNTGVISRIHTNSKKYATPKGYRIGMTVKQLVASKEKLGLDIEEGFLSLRIYSEQVSVTLDSISTNKFYQKNGLTLDDLDDGAIITEFGIF